MSEELKPCPFCGATNIAFYEGSTFRWMDVQCMECDARIECRKSDTAKVAEDPVNTLRGIEVWNTRNDRAVIDGFLARVRDELKKGYFTREQIVSLDLIFNIVAAEMFGKEGE